MLLRTSFQSGPHYVQFLDKYKGFKLLTKLLNIKESNVQETFHSVLLPLRLTTEINKNTIYDNGSIGPFLTQQSQNNVSGVQV